MNSAGIFASQTAEIREQAEVMMKEIEDLDLFAQGRQRKPSGMDSRRGDAGRMPSRSAGGPVKDVNELYGELLLQANVQGATHWFDRSGASAESQRLIWLAREYRMQRCSDMRERLQTFLKNIASPTPAA